MTALVNDVVMWEEITVENAQGQVEPMPAGATFVGSSDGPAGACTVGPHPTTGNPARAVNALHQTGSFNATVTATAPPSLTGLTAWVENFVIGPDVTPTQIGGNAPTITTVPQPLPPV